MIETRLFHISSLSGIQHNGSKLSSMSFYLPSFIKWEDDVKAIYFSVLKAEVPTSFYLINEYNNTISIQTSNGTSNYTLTEGNYNVNTFMTAMTSLLGSNYSFSYNSITNKMTMSSNQSFTILTENTTMSRFLGISDEENISSVNNSITSPYVCNFLPIQRLHFRTPDLYLDSYNAYDKSNDSILLLQNTTSNLGVITYSNTSNLKVLIDIDFLESVNIRITDDKNRSLNFHNVHWHLTFQIDYEYNDFPLRNSLNNFFKLYRKSLAKTFFENQLDNNDENVENDENL